MAAHLFSVPEWYSRVPTLESSAAIIISHRVSMNLMGQSPNQIWKSSLWRRTKRSIKYLPQHLRVALLEITRIILKRSGCDDGRILFTCWWIFFNEKCDDSIDVEPYDFFDGKFLIELIEYLGSVKTRAINASLSYNWVLHSSFQKMIQKQSQLKKITFYQTIRRDALVSISKGLDLESVTFDHSCNNHCSGEDLREFLEEQQETLKSFRWQCIYPGRYFNGQQNTELLLINLQVLELNAEDLHLIPEVTCKTVVRLDINVTQPTVTPDTDKRMKALKHLKITFHNISASVNAAFCSLFVNQPQVGSLHLELRSVNAEMPRFILSHIPSVQGASIYIHSDPPEFLVEPIPVLRELKGHCSSNLFEFLLKSPNIRRLELKVRGAKCVQVCIDELTRMSEKNQKLFIESVDLCFCGFVSNLSLDYVFKIFDKFEKVCPSLRELTIQKTVDKKCLEIQKTDELAFNLMSRGFRLKMRRLSVPIVRLKDLSPIYYLPICYCIQRY